MCYGRTADADEIPGEWQKGGDGKFSIKLLN